MSRISYLYGLVIGLTMLSLMGCGGGAGSAPGGTTPTVEVFKDADAEARAAYLASTLQVSGRVVDEQGVPHSGLSVRLGGLTTVSDANGGFTFAAVSRQNGLLQVTGSEVRELNIPVQLQGAAGESALALPTLVVSQALASETRLLFGGDVSFARRFLDPQETAARTEVPSPNPDALIQSDDPLPGSIEALSFVAPLLEQADYPILNLETPVLDEPLTPHPTKSFAYFSLSQSLPALTAVGVDYVALGNNHVYDYLGAGLSDTLHALDAVGLNHSGAGATPDEAFTPYRADLAGTPFSFVSATSVSGSQHEVLYVATDAQGGAADLRDNTRVQETINSEETAGRFVVAQLHTGKEYTFEPSAYAQGRMQLSVDAGADLVIAHHTHVAQGVSYSDGVLMFHGLGNFLFDQDRQETMLGLAAQVDVADSQTVRARGIPVYLEDYRPRPIGGDLANRFIRRIAEFSFDSATVFPYQSQAWIQPDASGVNIETLARSVDVTVPDSGVAIVDLRPLVPSEASLATASTNAEGVTVTPGRDILVYGDFEDGDVDSDSFEIARWDVSGDASFACQAWRYQGAQALCMTRSESNIGNTIASFRNRIRVMGDATDEPNKDLSLIGYVRGDNAGPVSIVSRYYPSSGSGDFGEEQAFAHPGGTFGWQMFHSVLNMPADLPEFDDNTSQNPRALRLFLHHSPMVSGVGLAVIDELAVVSWEAAQNASEGALFSTPHGRDFLRVEAPSGDYVLSLEFDRYVPAVVGE